MEQRGWTPGKTDLIIAAHGSGRSQNPATVTAEFAEKLGAFVTFNSLRVGFVEQPPSISEAASGTGDTAICLPFFACTGGHVLEDVPTELNRAGFTGLVMPVIGELPLIQRHIAARLTTSLIRPNQQ